ncbi:MAG: PKD domain-containing protein, partial [Sphingobacteriales bacterium]
MTKKLMHLMYLTALVVASASIISCKDNAEIEQAEGRVFFPRIFKELTLFPESADSVRVLNLNEPYTFSGLGYSPADEVQVAWKVNGTQVSAEKSYTFTASEPGEFRVTLEASHNGDTARRYRDFFVLPAAEAAYQPKTYNRVVLSYLSDNTGHRGIADIDYSKATHVAYKSGTVAANGTISYAIGDQFKRMEHLVAKAHMNGVRALLGVSGTLSADGWAVNNNYNFGNAIVNATTRAALVQSIKNYITLKKLDGIDVMMTDVSGATANVTNNMVAVGRFLNDLRAALGNEKIITATVTADFTHPRYPANSLAAANWLNVHAFEDGLHVGPDKPLGQPSGLNYMIASADIWKAKYGASKLVIGISTLGIRYNTLLANGNNATWTSFDYIPYKDILYRVPDAFDKEYAAISQGVYFNGIPLVTQKAEYLKQNNYLGAYLWAGNGDVSGKNLITGATGERSILTTIYNT